MTPEQLKASILQYAIQGKLVEQRSEEGTAEELYQQIQDAKQKLNKEVKIKKEKHLDEIEEGEIPFDVPESWKWVRIGKIVYSVTAGGDKPSDFSETKDVKHPVPVVANGVTNDGIIGYTSQARAKAGTITIAGRGTIGFSLLRNYDYCPVVRLIVVDIPPMLCPEYLQYVIQALPEKSVGTSIPQLTVPMLLPKVIPLPPLEEQHRIVAKIEELLPYVDRYAEAYEKLEQFNAKFPEDMKKSILQYAIQGKLVEQRPEDGTAEDLYRRIKTGNKVKEIDPEECPFDIPDNWKWVRMGEIGDTNIGLTYKPTDKSDQGVIVLRSSNIQNGRMDYADIVKVQCEIPERAMISKGDLLICARNGSRSLVGKTAVVDQDGMAFGAFMAKFSSPINSFIYYFLQSPIFRGQLDGVKTETINQITQDMLKNQLLPLPPLEEQHRIVDKIEELLPYCDRLLD